MKLGLSGLDESQTNAILFIPSIFSIVSRSLMPLPIIRLCCFYDRLMRCIRPYRCRAKVRPFGVESAASQVRKSPLNPFNRMSHLFGKHVQVIITERVHLAFRKHCFEELPNLLFLAVIPLRVKFEHLPQGCHVPKAAKMHWPCKNKRIPAFRAASGKRNPAPCSPAALLAVGNKAERLHGFHGFLRALRKPEADFHVMPVREREHGLGCEVELREG